MNPLATTALFLLAARWHRWCSHKCLTPSALYRAFTEHGAAMAVLYAPLKAWRVPPSPHATRAMTRRHQRRRGHNEFRKRTRIYEECGSRLQVNSSLKCLPFVLITSIRFAVLAFESPTLPPPSTKSCRRSHGRSSRNFSG